MPRKSVVGNAIPTGGIISNNLKADSNHTHPPIELNTLNKVGRTEAFKAGQTGQDKKVSSIFPLSGKTKIIIAVIVVIILVAVAVGVPVGVIMSKKSEVKPEVPDQLKRSGQQAPGPAPVPGPATASGPAPVSSQSLVLSQPQVQTSASLQEKDNSNITRVLLFTLEKLLKPEPVIEQESPNNKKILLNNINDIYNINNKIINLVTNVDAKFAIITGIKIKNCKIILTRWQNNIKETKEYVQYMKDTPDDWLDPPFNINFPYYQIATIYIMSEILLLDSAGQVIKNEQIFEKEITKEIKISIPFVSFKIRNCKVTVKQPSQIEEVFEHRTIKDDTNNIKNDSKCYLKKSFAIDTEYNNQKTITIVPIK